MTITEAIEHIKSRPLTDFIPLEKSSAGMYCCPACGSGKGKNKSGAFKIYKSNNRCICYANNCFTEKGEDTLGALKIIWQCEDTAEALRRAGYNLSYDSTPSSPKSAAAEPVKREPVKLSEAEPIAPEEDYTAQYLRQNAFLLQAEEAEEARAYLQSRGITADSIKRFCIGYEPNFKHPKNPYSSATTKRIIIPRTKGSYLARAIEETEHPKVIVGTQHAVFNSCALKNTEAAAVPAVLIVEGEIDAISIMQLFPADALSVVTMGSANSTKGILAAIEQTAPESIYMLALDNDDTGRAAQERLKLQLEEKKISCISLDTAAMYGAAKDANAALQTDEGRKAIVNAIITAVDEASEIYAEQQKRKAMLTGSAMLDAFIAEIQSEKYKPFSTGMSELDAVLQGGFCREELILIGGAPGIGKTTFTMQLAERMAEQGANILYFNLEMSRQQLLAKTLSRRIYQDTAYKIDAKTILQGYKWTDYQAKLIAKAAKAYKPIAECLQYNPEGCSAAIEDILQEMEKAAAVAEAKGEAAPIVVIDYLHLVTSRTKSEGQEIVKLVVKGLKDYAIKHKSVVLLITAFNRDANRNGKATTESGRDSSSIEYTADTYIGLNFTALEEGGSSESIEQLKSAEPKEVTLKVLKQRLGSAGTRSNVNYLFYGANNYFVPKP